MVEVWKGGPNSFAPEMYHVTKLGFPTILSSCWYLSSITFGPDWVKFYQCEPYNFSGKPQLPIVSWVLVDLHVELNPTPEMHYLWSVF